MTKVLDVRVPGEVHAKAIPGGVEVGIAVDGRTVAWKPLSCKSALEAADALEGRRDGFEDAGFLAGRRGDKAYMSFLGLVVRMDW